MSYQCHVMQRGMPAPRQTQASPRKPHRGQAPATATRSNAYACLISRANFIGCAALGIRPVAPRVGSPRFPGQVLIERKGERKVTA